MKKKKHKSIWKRTLSFDEFVKIPKLPHNSIDVKQEYEQYLITRNYFILKKSLKRAIRKGEDYTDSFKKKWRIFSNLCWINNLPNDLGNPFDYLESPFNIMKIGKRLCQR